MATICDPNEQLFSLKTKQNDHFQKESIKGIESSKSIFGPNQILFLAMLVFFIYIHQCAALRRLGLIHDETLE